MTRRAEATTGQRRSRFNRRAVLAAPLALGLATLGGCSRGPEQSAAPTPSGSKELLAWPADDVWPAPLLKLPDVTLETYRSVAANRELLQYIPCYCNCASYGHTSVFDCYVAEERADGSILLDTMGFT